MGHDLTLIVEIVYTRENSYCFTRGSRRQKVKYRKRKEKLKSHREIDKDETC